MFYIARRSVANLDLSSKLSEESGVHDDFCIMMALMEGFGSRRPKNLWIRIRNTGYIARRSVANLDPRSN